MKSSSDNKISNLSSAQSSRAMNNSRHGKIASSVITEEEPNQREDQTKLTVWEWKIAFRVRFATGDLGMRFQCAQFPETVNGYYSMTVYDLIGDPKSLTSAAATYNELLPLESQHNRILPGLRITHINDECLNGILFMAALRRLQIAARPVTLTFVNAEAGPKIFEHSRMSPTQRRETVNVVTTQRLIPLAPGPTSSAALHRAQYPPPVVPQHVSAALQSTLPKGRVPAALPADGSALGNTNRRAAVAGANTPSAIVSQVQSKQLSNNTSAPNLPAGASKSNAAPSGQTSTTHPKSHSSTQVKSTAAKKLDKSQSISESSTKPTNIKPKTSSKADNKAMKDLDGTRKKDRDDKGRRNGKTSDIKFIVCSGVVGIVIGFAASTFIYSPGNSGAESRSLLRLPTTWNFKNVVPSSWAAVKVSLAQLAEKVRESAFRETNKLSHSNVPAIGGALPPVK